MRRIPERHDREIAARGREEGGDGTRRRDRPVAVLERAVEALGLVDGLARDLLMVVEHPVRIAIP
jgi:hypothetical protein